MLTIPQYFIEARQRRAATLLDLLVVTRHVLRVLTVAATEGIDVQIWIVGP